MDTRSNLRALGFAILTAGLLSIAPSPPPSAAAVAATLEARHASRVSGVVVLHPQGDHTLVELKLEHDVSLGHAFSLHAGRDCTDERYSGPIVPLNPAGTGHTSQTLVAMPIEKFGKSNYVVDVRDATTRAQFPEACAHL